MTSRGHYTAERARQGLKQFAAGRVINGIVGLGMVILLVRVLPPAEYGAYVTLLAGLEIIALASSCGVFGFAQRYFPELRIKGDSTMIGRALQLSIALRTGTLVICATALLIASSWLLGLMGFSMSNAALRAYGVLLVAEGTCRYLDVVTESFLLQGMTQISSFIRSGLKFVVLGALLFFDGFDLTSLLVMESLGSVTALFVVLYGLKRYLRHDTSSCNNEYSPSWREIIRFSRDNYFALLFGQLYGYNTLKVLLSWLNGVAATASYGFAHSLADVVRRYLPAQLLVGLIRPMIISSYSETGQVHRPLFLSNLVLKLNVFLLVPILSVVAAFGGVLLNIFAKGKYPDAHVLLVALMFLLILQTLHSILAILAMTLERSELVLRATNFAALGLPVAVLTIPALGGFGAIIAAVISEIAYCLVLVIGLGNRYQVSILDLSGHYRIWFSGFVAGFGAWILVSWIKQPILVASIGSLLLFFIYFAAMLTWKSFSNQERITINKMLPMPLFVW